MNGSSHQNPISSALPISRTLLEIAVLSLIGLAAIALRTRLRIPLNIPGHHGLEVMAILLIGRQWSKMTLAGSVSTLAASFLLLTAWAGIKDPFLPLIYILMGATIDLFYRLLGDRSNALPALALVGGLSYALIPLSRLLIQLTTGFPYESFLKTGYLYPIASHLIFGALGGLLAGLVMKGSRSMIAKD